jgi:hypothetical protein
MGTGAPLGIKRPEFEDDYSPPCVAGAVPPLLHMPAFMAGTEETLPFPEAIIAPAILTSDPVVGNSAGA